MPHLNATADLIGYASGLLRGRMIKLRPLEDGDLPLLAQWWNDPAAMVLQQDRAMPRGLSAAEELFRSWSANPGETGFGYSVVNDADELVGHVALWGITPTVRIGTLAIMIGPPYVEQGYGTDALRVALRLAFDELGVNKVELQVWSFNERAQHVYEKFGFVEEGRRRAAVFHRSAFADQVLMGMLRHEYVDGAATDNG